MSKLAVQMYTVRDFTKTRADLEASLKKIKATVILLSSFPPWEQ
jgi:hypothetical protein